MKKLLFLLSIPACLFIIASCNNNSSKTETSVVDSAHSDSAAQPAILCASGDSSEIAYWQIPTTTADSMITHNGSTGKPSGIKYAREHIQQKLKDAFGSNYIGLVGARYRVADVERYRTKRCISPTDSAGMVADYFTKIAKVKVKKDSLSGSQISYEYYDIVTICPPPYDGSCSVAPNPGADSAKSKKK